MRPRLSPLVRVATALVVYLAAHFWGYTAASVADRMLGVAIDHR